MEPIVIFASGQSQCLGRITAPAELHITNSSVKVWNNDANSFVNADLLNDSYRTVLGDSFGGGKNNAVIWFADRVQKETDAVVYVVIEAAGGKQIHNWVTGNYTERMNKVLSQALASRADISYSNVKYFVWLQGEADLRSGVTEADYAASFDHVMSQVSAEYKITAPISQGYIDNNGTIGQLGVQDFFVSLGSPYKVADVTGLTLGDTAHYDAASVKELGYNRLWEALSETAPIPDPVETVDVLINGVKVATSEVVDGKINLEIK